MTARPDLWSDVDAVGRLSWSDAIARGIARPKLGRPAPTRWVGPALEARIEMARQDKPDRRALLAALDRFEISQHSQPTPTAPILITLVALLWSGTSAAFLALEGDQFLSLVVSGTAILYLTVATYWAIEALHHVFIDRRRIDRAAAAAEVRRLIDAGTEPRRRWWDRVRR